jgi:intracellular sulfur oxidation DsrE/DsrF family protein
MANQDMSPTTHRRKFLGSIATGAATLGLASLANPFQLNAAPEIRNDASEADAWFDKIKGKHRMVFDVTGPHEIFPFAWPKVFLVTNGMTGSPETDCGVVVVLRHSSIPYAMNNDLWTKYKFGEMFKVEDAKTKAAATSNPFWQREPDKLPGVGEVQIGITDLQKSGIMFCVCGMAMTVYSAAAAMQSNGDANAIKNEWISGVLPGIQVVPSGVWAVGRAQEHGCGYCFAG